MDERPATSTPKRGGAPIGNRFAFVHGHYSREAIAERKAAREARDAERSKSRMKAQHV